MIQARLTPIRDFFNEIYVPRKLARASEGHKNQINVTLNHLDRFTAEKLHNQNIYIEQIDDEIVDRFKAWRSTSKQVSAATVNRDLRNVRALVNFACRRKYRTERLDIDFEREEIDPPVAWYPEELEKIFESARQEKGVIPETKIPAVLFWQALPAVVFSSGARITAVMSTPISQFDAKRGILEIRAKYQKQKSGQVFALHSTTLEVLNELVAADPNRERLFPWPYDQNKPGWPALNYHYRRILRRAGLPLDRKRLWHCIRKTNLTLVNNAGGEEAARKQAGHSSVAVTRRYFDPRQSSDPTAKDLIPEPTVLSSRPKPKPKPSATPTEPKPDDSEKMLLALMLACMMQQMHN